MNLLFSWKNILGARTPICNSDVCNKEGVDFLGSLLMDDGGVSYLESTSWLDYGASLVNEIRMGKSKEADWCSQVWGASLSLERVRVYHAYDEDYFVDMGFDDFEKALLGWRQFIVS